MNQEWLARDLLEQHSVDMRQFIDFRQVTFENGSRIVEAYNSSGLTFSVLPDRGLDIWTAHYKGIPLTWISMGSPHPPDFGQNWLWQFNGGLVTTCGLTHAGGWEDDAITGEKRGLHGNISQLRAYHVNVQGEWSHDHYAMTLSGVISEGRLSGEQLRLHRTYRMSLGQPVIEIEDRVQNRGDRPAPLMLLYHINLGYPLVRAGARLHTPSHAVYPRDEVARPGFDRWPDYDAPTAQYPQQVFFHHLNANAEGVSRIALAQDDFGLEVEWDTSTLPYFTQWKNTCQGMYVSGVEPGNCIPEGQNAARDHGRLVHLEPGEDQTFRVRLAVLDGAEAVQCCLAEIYELRHSGSPVSGCRLDEMRE